MIKLSTNVSCGTLGERIGLQDKILVVGSCFADAMGKRMAEAGFDVLVNPFGTLYNPCSIAMALERLESGTPFTAEDCVEMGAGAGRICSFSHHTSFARESAEEFLANANDRLASAAAFWKKSTKVIITLGTSYVWYHDGKPVANCLKRPGTEFTHNRLSLDRVIELRRRIEELCARRGLIFTVSPIRHLGDGAHSNTLSKATLQLALDGCAGYFPAYEIVMDELRDYRFYAEDLVHPSPVAEAIIWERFIDCAVIPSDLPSIEANEKAARSSRHISAKGQLT